MKARQQAQQQVPLTTPTVTQGSNPLRVLEATQQVPRKALRQAENTAEIQTSEARYFHEPTTEELMECLENDIRDHWSEATDLAKRKKTLDFLTNLDHAPCVRTMSTSQ